MADPARHLKAVDAELDPILVHPETGEQLGTLGDATQELNDEIAGLQSTIKSQASTISKLRRKKAEEARQNPLWPKARELFNYWREQCNHPKSEFSPERFELIEPRLKKHGEAVCRRAIDGAAYDPFVTKRKNGSLKRHDGLHLIFDPHKFEEFANKAPRQAQQELLDDGRTDAQTPEEGATK